MRTYSYENLQELEKQALRDLMQNIGLKAILETLQELDSEEVVKTIHVIFDKNVGKNFTLSVLTSLVWRDLGAQTSSFTDVENKVESYIFANTQGKVDKETKEEERPNSLFVSVRGKNGGLFRRADIEK